MFYTILQRGNIYRAGDSMDVICYDADASTLRVRVTGDATGFPANVLQILPDGSSSAPVSNSAGSTSVTTTITIDTTDLKDYYLVRTGGNTALYGRELIVEALNSSGLVLKSERFYINNPASRYKKVSMINSLESAIAEYTARLPQIRALRSKSFMWDVDIVLDPPPAPEIFFALAPTQVFGVENLFEKQVYGQGIDMITNADIRIMSTSLSPAFSRLISMINQHNNEKRGMGRGVAMIEFHNEYFSLVVNNVVIGPDLAINTSGGENNANANASGILVSLTGRSQFELISGFTDKQSL